MNLAGKLNLLRARYIDAEVAQRVLHHEHLHGPPDEGTVEQFELEAREAFDTAIGEFARPPSFTAARAARPARSRVARAGWW